MHQTFDLNVLATAPLITPRALKDALPMSPEANSTVVVARDSIIQILRKQDPRLIVIVGPCSIHDEAAAMDYAQRLKTLADDLKDQFVIVMRTYFEKPRTTIGWKGLINDPHLDGSYDMALGLRIARQLLLRISEMGLPTATEVLDPIVPQYIADLQAWAAIGARTTESQTHRELASGLSMPVGFKNSTDGNLQIAIDALLSSRHPHHFLGIDQDGRTCVVATRGNPYGHIILRGGHDGPNYDPVSIVMTEEHLVSAGLEPQIMIDCSHGNSGKRPKLQAHVLKSVIQQRLDGNTSIVGVMLESSLEEGSQPLTKEPDKMAYGVSITDACLSWEATESLLRFAHDELASGSYAGRIQRSF